jgi:hypothetical protein
VSGAVDLDAHAVGCWGDKGEIARAAEEGSEGFEDSVVVAVKKSGGG